MDCNGRIVGIGAGTKESANYSSLIWRSTCGVVQNREEGLRLDYHGKGMCRGLSADWSRTGRAREVEEGVLVGSHDGYAAGGTRGWDSS